MPDGTSNVPVEQVIALVAQDVQELASLQTPSTSSPSSYSSPAPSSPLASPRHPAQFNIPLSSPRTPAMTTRRLSLFEMHTMGYGQRSLHASVPPPTARILGSAPRPSPAIQQQGSPDDRSRK